MKNKVIEQINNKQNKENNFVNIDENQVDKLSQLFSYINGLNNYANPVYINEDNNYYYFKINNGHISEVYKKSLYKYNKYELLSEAKYILDRYL